MSSGSLDWVKAAAQDLSIGSRVEPTSARATRLIIVIAALLFGATAAGFAATPGMAGTRVSRSGVLTGTWKGTLSVSAGGTIRRERILIVVNARQSGGRWKVSPTCHGNLTLDGVSGGSHHYRQRAAAGASCLGGDIDCLWRTGANVYDSVTPRPGGYAFSGTLHRVRTA
jgi:hypothetical protein